VIFESIFDIDKFLEFQLGYKILCADKRKRSIMVYDIRYCFMETLFTTLKEKADLTLTFMIQYNPKHILIQTKRRTKYIKIMTWLV
jgi:hypothetical protein